MRHKYTKGQNLKYCLSFPASLFQIFIKKPQRKNGISVMMRVNNEEKWIAQSLLSLNEFADEVVVINNNSTDNTLQEIENVKPELKFKLILENENSNDICKVSNHALSLTSYRWIFRWDSDFIAYTSGDRNIKHLREYLLNLNPRKFYLIFPATFSFAGDIFHVKIGKETNSEGYIHTWHPKLKYVRKGKFEILKVPFYYKIKRLEEIFFVHIGSAKSVNKLLHRFFWLYWQDHLKEFSEIDDYIKDKLQKKYDGIDPEQFVKMEFKRLILPIRKYKKSEFGDYPELLKENVKNPEFKVIYKNGEPVDRSDFNQ
ncbi:MAG: glycosyltransferase family 2 protein [Candidatus Cloacimonetes bacterium]|nr:glycosyltransferase family 2 protein [Candidatus Cloacimonadota bacterium]MCF7867525.1 glycosyltransferase family 2 protein [Candidatus Cloacimonadota bacterium]MCF7882973.1 glycosyltransferase family 2 protein [Candidatus Cloacimonadota bacterium]